MKTLSLTLFLALVYNFVFAQSKYIDSLSKRLSIATDDKSKILLLADIAYQYRLIKPDTALLLGQKALDWQKQSISHMENQQL